MSTILSTRTTTSRFTDQFEGLDVDKYCDVEITSQVVNFMSQVVNFTILNISAHIVITHHYVKR